MPKIILLFLLFTQLTFAQDRQPDYLLYDWDVLITVYVHDTFSEITEYYIEDTKVVMDQERISNVERSEILKHLGLDSSQILPLNKLSSVTEEDLVNKHFRFKTDIDEVGFNFYPNKKYMSRFFWEKDELEDVFLMNYRTVTIANIDFVVLYDDYLETDSLGFMCKIGDRFLICYDDTIVKTYPKRDKTDTKKDFHRAFEWDKELEYFLQEGKLGLRDAYTGRIIIEPHYDSILKSNPVVAYRNNKIDVYNVFGKPLLDEDIKVAYHRSGMIQLLDAENKMWYTDHSGKLYREPDFEMHYLVCGLGYQDQGIEIFKDQDRYYLEETLFDLFVVFKDSLANVYLSKNELDKFSERHELLEDSLRKTSRVYFNIPQKFDSIYPAKDKQLSHITAALDSTLIVSKRKRFSVYEFKDKALNTVGENYDSVENFNNRYLKLHKDDLYCYYPQASQPRYASLEVFRDFFARFELPDGRKGWLDIYGNEYYDE